MTWCWYSFTLTLGLFFTGILCAIAVIMAEGCEVIGKALND